MNRSCGVRGLLLLFSFCPCLLLEAGQDKATSGTRETDEIRARHIEMAKYLIERGADVSKPYFGRNCHPIQSAATRGEAEIIQLLLDHGASPNEVGTGLWYPPHLAAFYNHADCVRVLLKHKEIQINVKGIGDLDDLRSSTPLHVAASKGNTEVVQVLLDAGADPRSRDQHGESPYECAVRWNQSATAALLRGR